MEGRWILPNLFGFGIVSMQEPYSFHRELWARYGTFAWKNLAERRYMISALLVSFMQALCIIGISARLGLKPDLWG